MAGDGDRNGKHKALGYDGGTARVAGIGDRTLEWVGAPLECRGSVDPKIWFRTRFWY